MHVHPERYKTESLGRVTESLVREACHPEIISQAVSAKRKLPQTPVTQPDKVAQPAQPLQRYDVMRHVVKETPERSDIVRYAQHVAAAPQLPGAGTAWSRSLESPEYIGCAPNAARLAPLSVPMVAIGGVPYCKLLAHTRKSLESQRRALNSFYPPRNHARLGVYHVN